MILELMPSFSETYHVFLKTIACSICVVVIHTQLLPFVCVLRVLCMLCVRDVIHNVCVCMRTKLNMLCLFICVCIGI